MKGGGPPHGLKEEQNLGPQEIWKQIRYTLTGYAVATVALDLRQERGLEVFEVASVVEPARNIAQGPFCEQPPTIYFYLTTSYLEATGQGYSTHDSITR